MRTKTIAWLVLTSALLGALGAVALTLVAVRPLALEPRFDVEPVVLVGRIQALARLQTAQVDLQTTVRGSRGEGWMLRAAGEELVFQGIGRAIAGVDLAHLGPEDVWVDGEGVVWVRLPEAEVFQIDLDEDRSSVLYREQGWFAKADRNLEKQARQVAIKQLEAQAEVLGVEQAAAEQAQVVVGDLIRSLGATDVRFVDELPGLPEAASGT